MSSHPKPTAAELEILGVLWRLGPSTVRQVHEALGEHRASGYTTTLKFLQIMAEKGLVVREESARAHVYTPAVERAATEGRLVDELRERVFGGSAAALVLRALESRTASEEELASIRRMLDQYQEKAK